MGLQQGRSRALCIALAPPRHIVPLPLLPPLHLAAPTRRFRPPLPAPAPRRAALCVRAAADNGQFAFEEGAAVKVVAPIKVYHVPKHPEVQLEGMKGTVKKVAALHKGQVLSANLQYRVQFLTQIGGADVKFFAHLVSSQEHGRGAGAWRGAASQPPQARPRGRPPRTVRAAQLAGAPYRTAPPLAAGGRAPGRQRRRSETPRAAAALPGGRRAIAGAESCSYSAPSSLFPNAAGRGRD
jgi:hypothetical protein